MTPINKPGAYTIPEDDYHADPCAVPSLSRSIAHTLVYQSPLHAWCQHPRLNPQHESQESERFDLGSAAHAMLLGGSAPKIAVIDADDWRTKAAKAARDEARANGLTPILRKHDYSVRKMVEAARKAIERSPYAGCLDDGSSGQTLVWQDGASWCRCLVDRMTAGNSLILDYKTTESAAPSAWSRGHIVQHGYDMQCEWYKQGAEAVFGTRPSFVFIVQEIHRPYAVSFVTLCESFADVARGKIAFALARWRQAMSSNQWPGYSSFIAEPPPWELTEHEMRMADVAAMSAPVQSDDDAQAVLFGASGGKDGNLLKES